eukprot:1419398-Amphidinium_carterae.1
MSIAAMNATTWSGVMRCALECGVPRIPRETCLWRASFLEADMLECLAGVAGAPCLFCRRERAVQTRFQQYRMLLDPRASW